ncbi:MAG: amidohydrolase family protein [Gammaproteobacteria bacterium]|jgi:N-acyl-D-aspartate/D-glutamate deacylase|nr:amidohydrolase family protein [Gammaproteobacteria bacterium]MDG1232473.1 amidohydrolase family protein [Pseudomonadales bacterium]MBT5154169.1 amidohydrolase family protein [Gammaproteobacteria bacterium]MBT5685173.1 amidohydrolase family protein [Gammaproteobacteria bacterium]MBT5725937.1 amidohydrolase family protein [Gammaproteobacteria bacterium]
MSDFDVVIRNGSLVDGTGSEPVTGDIAILDGKIAQVGIVAGIGREEIDASNLAVAPGFIDIHTHFDPQLCWDSHATPSIEHGITTVVTGNCSLSLAPIRDRAAADKIVSMFGVIEDIKQRTFDEAVPFTWNSFPEYLDHIRPKLGINVGALIGHSAIRLFVMGAASQERAAEPEEIEAMCELVEESMAAGALGISSSYVDMDENGNPVPSQYADIHEKIALAKAMAKSGRGIWQIVPFFPDLNRELDNIRELGDISLAAGIPCSLQPVLSSPTSPHAEEIIAALEEQRDRGARVYGQVMPRCFDLNMRLSETSMLLFALPQWKSIMDLPASERLAKFSDPAARDLLVSEMKNAAGMSGALPFLTVGDVHSKANEVYKGKYLAEIAESEGKEIGDVILDIAIADKLETEFQLKNVINADKAAVAELINHPLCHFGASDAGAHITQFCGTGDTTHLLEHYVRETGHMTLERAVHRMTGEVAADWGFSDRGTLAVGMAADIVVFDPDAVTVGLEQFVDDFPGEARRYVRRSSGYHSVFVNGELAYDTDGYTDNLAGRIV